MSLEEEDDKTRRKQRLKNRKRDADRPDERIGDATRKTPRKRIDPRNWEECYEDDWDNEE